MNLTNIKKAWVSTAIGVAITIVSTAVQSFADGTFAWKTFVATAVVALGLAVTDILKEVKKDLETGE